MIKRRMAVMILIKEIKKGVPIWQFEKWQNHTALVHGFSSRYSSVHKDDWFNMGLYVGEDLEKVLKSRFVFLNALDIESQKGVSMEQVHGINVENITALPSVNEKGIIEINKTDGLITNQKKIPLLACFADCVPLFFYDKEKEVIALSHGGWRGTVGGIAQETIRSMEELYACQVQNISCAIGPSIGACCYKVGDNVLEEVKKYPWWQEVIIQKEDGIYLDLWQTNRLQLLDMGLKEDNILMSNLCTQCNMDEFFSYRGEQGKTGRMMAIMMLK